MPVLEGSIKTFYAYVYTEVTKSWWHCKHLPRLSAEKKDKTFVMITSEIDVSLRRLVKVQSKWAKNMEIKTFAYNFFLEDISPFCGATDTPVLDFWWGLPRGSKPVWIPYGDVSLWFKASVDPLLVYLSSMCNGFLRSRCDNCWPLGSQHGSQPSQPTFCSP